MKDLSREETIEQRIATLEREIWHMENAIDNKKWMRAKKTFFYLCGAIYLLLFFYVLKNGTGDINISDVKSVFALVLFLTVGVGFVAGVVMFISVIVTAYLAHGALQDEKAIAKKLGELEALKFSKYNKE